MGKDKLGWKVAAIVLGVLIAAAVAGNVLILLPFGLIRSGDAQPGNEAAEAGVETEAVQPAQEEMQPAESVLVTASGSGRGTSDTSSQDEGTGESRRYEVIEERMTWKEAEAYCEERGGHLATVESEAEYMDILDVADTTSRNVLWMGANRESGAFEWVNGEGGLIYTNWMKGEPNDETGDEDYLVMFVVDGSWVWADVPNDLSSFYGEDSVGFICEWDD